VLAQIVGNLFDVEYNRHIKEREENNQRQENQLVIRIAGVK